VIQRSASAGSVALASFATWSSSTDVRLPLGDALIFVVAEAAVHYFLEGSSPGKRVPHTFFFVNNNVIVESACGARALTDYVELTKFISKPTVASVNSNVIVKHTCGLGVITDDLELRKYISKPGTTVSSF
jgi:hypothetical protein